MTKYNENQSFFNAPPILKYHRASGSIAFNEYQLYNVGIQVGNVHVTSNTAKNDLMRKKTATSVIHNYLTVNNLK